MGFEPALGVAKIWTCGLDEAPEAARMILLLQVHQLVNQHVVAHSRRHLHEAMVECDFPGARTRSPSRSLVANREAGDGQMMRGGKRVQSWTKLFACEQPQVRLDKWTKVSGDGRHGDGTFTVAGAAAARLFDDANRDRLTTEHHRGAVNPGRRDVRGQNPRSLLRDPVGVLLEKTHRLEARATPRHGHADAAVRTDPNDVPPCAAHPNKVDRTQRPGWFGRRSAKKWKIELHGWCWPMIAQQLDNSGGASDGTGVTSLRTARSAPVSTDAGVNYR